MNQMKMKKNTKLIQKTNNNNIVTWNINYYYFNFKKLYQTPLIDGYLSDIPFNSLLKTSWGFQKRYYDIKIHVFQILTNIFNTFIVFISVLSFCIAIEHNLLRKEKHWMQEVRCSSIMQFPPFMPL